MLLTVKLLDLEVILTDYRLGINFEFQGTLKTLNEVMSYSYKIYCGFQTKRRESLVYRKYTK